MKFNISFPQEKDGLSRLSEASQVFESDFKFPYLASSGDYLNQLDFSHKRRRVKVGSRMKATTESTFEKSLLGYQFRVNTEVDKEDNVISANYGKILGEFTTRVRPNTKSWKGYVKFTYYYNPAKNDRSLEFDQQRNLFKGLTRQEQPKQP